MNAPDQADATARARAALARFVADGDPDDLRTAADIVEGLPPQSPGRARLAADVVTAVVRLASPFSHVLLDRLTALLDIAAADQPAGKQWAATRPGALALATLYDTILGRIDPGAALDQLSTIEPGEDDDGRVAGVIGAARQVIERISAVAAGDFAQRDAVAGLRQMRSRFGGNPTIDALIEANEAVDAALTWTGPHASVQVAAQRVRAAMRLVPQDSDLHRHMRSVADMVEAVRHDDVDAQWAPSGDAALDNQRVLASVQAALAQLSQDAPVSAEKIDEVTGRIRSVLAGMAEDHSLRPFVLLHLGLAVQQRYKVLGNRADLAELAGILDTVRRHDLVPTGDDQRLAASMQAFVSYEHGDGDTARRQLLERLRGYSWSVLQQADTVSATKAASGAASEAMQFAARCLHDDAVSDAVAALDAGRGLVLLAATELHRVATRLDALGRSDLADGWRAATGAGTQGRVPLELRKAVVATLSAASPAGPVDPPTIAEIRTSLSTLDADALVYLVPGGTDRPGVAVVVPVAGEPYWTSLPHLDGGGEALERFVRATAHRSAAEARGTGPPAGNGRDLPADPHRAFPAGLDRVCEWAWRAAVGPVLDLVARSTPAPSGRVRRLVMIPMGDLARVPWHAARRPGDGAYAIQECALSYEVSARAFCESARRPGVRVSSLGFVLGDPDTTDPSTGLAAASALPAARAEAFAVREAFYRAATYAGRRPDGTTGAGGAGGRDAVRAWLTAQLPSSGAMLHLACHGITRSAAEHDSSCLVLAGGERLPAEQLVGLIAQRRAPIGLVVLAACRSGVSTRGYDEAYSLGTAFVAAGVRTVLSTQWSIPDDSTSLLMFMFHHYLRHEGHRPWDALRRAQLWMLDPDRQVPVTMPRQLRSRFETVADLGDPTVWAAFIHMGQ